ncbi:MAG: DHH family phosphoesterase [Oscillospiraceae bacterium]|nr:DHH family phosphoesterase [Oscillospiraceae bacterium]MBR7085252.1 DHH family phosphoesterase [Oscillospiraceae bacterium]
MKPRYRTALWGVTIFLLLLTIIATAVLFRSGTRYSFLYSLPSFLLAGVTGYTLLDTHRYRVRYIAQLSRECTEAELAMFQNLEMGLCVLDDDGILLHYNDYFNENILIAEDMFGKKLNEFLPLDASLEMQEIHWQDCYYQVKAVPYQGQERNITAFLWSDVTELKKIKQEYQNSRPCVMLIVVDSYEDLIQNAKESVRLEVSAAIEKLLEQFISETNGILKRLKNDRFIAIIEEEHIQQLMAEKFHILDDARNIHADDKNCVTFSIGVGHGAATMQESEAWAVQCLDMALGRGGDQAAVKTESGFRFFGGVSKGVEKKSRAKTRIIAGAIQELIQNSANVYLMGHRFGDLDSIGSACGLAGAIQLMEIPVNVVVDPEKNLSKQLISLVEKDLGKELFLTPQQAIDTITDDTLLIIVDTHNKDILESAELYHAAQKVIVIDHHRKNVNYVDNAVVFYHEPYASSACEMVTELLQYFKLNTEVNACCANCLLSGIMLDTKNFVMRTGVRTFEAAAYLKKIGADTVKVKGLFSGSIDNYKSRAEIVSSAEIIGCHAIAIAPKHTSDVRLVAPQAADELLSISNVDAAFVIYAVKNSVSISARSLGAVNVQVIMEQLGGGGHQTMAATQIPDMSPEEAKNQLLEVLAELHQDNN